MWETLSKERGPHKTQPFLHSWWHSYPLVVPSQFNPGHYVPKDTVIILWQTAFKVQVVCESEWVRKWVHACWLTQIHILLDTLIQIMINPVIGIIVLHFSKAHCNHAWNIIDFYWYYILEFNFLRRLDLQKHGSLHSQYFATDNKQLQTPHFGVCFRRSRAVGHSIKLFPLFLYEFTYVPQLILYPLT